MSDDSDHAASPEQRAKRQRTGSDAEAAPILAFDTMGPDDTTADYSLASNERSEDAPAPQAETRPLIQTTEEISRLQMENVRLRVELDELRKQLHALQQRRQDEQDARDFRDETSTSIPTQELEARIIDLEARLVSAEEDKRQLEQQAAQAAQAAADRAANHAAEHATAQNAEDVDTVRLEEAKQDTRELQASHAELLAAHRELQAAQSDLRETNIKLQEANSSLEKDKVETDARLLAAESETQRMRAVIEDLQAQADRFSSQDELRSRIANLERELQLAHRLEPRIDELETENAALHAALEHKQEQLVSMQRHDNADARLNTENEELKEMLVDLGVRDYEREQQLQTLSSAKEELTTKLATSESGLEAAQAETRRQAEKILSLETAAKSAEIQIKETTHRMAMAEEALELKESQNTELRDELHHFAAHDNEQSETLRRLNLQQSHLQRLNEDFKQRTASQDITITEQKAEIKALHSQCSDQAQSLEETQRERQELDRLCQTRARALDERERQVKELTQRVEQLTSNVHELEESLAAKTEQAQRQAEAAFQQRRAAEDELKRVHSEHARELEALNHEHNAELATQLGLQQRTLEDMKQREAEMTEANGKLVQKLRAQVASLRADAASSESEHGTIKAQLDETRAQLNQTLQTLDDLQARATEDRSRYTAEKNRLERHSSELEARSSRLQIELDELRRKDKAMDERVQKLQQSLADQSVELTQLKTPPASDAGNSTSSSQDSVSEAESIRREYAAQTQLWQHMRDEMAEHINRMSSENSMLRAELERWHTEEAQRAQAVEESLKRKFVKHAEQLESLASFKEEAQNALVSVAQEDVRKLTEENIGMRREHAALYERAENLEIHANQAAAELSRMSTRLTALESQLRETQDEAERLRGELKHAHELVAQGQTRTTELEETLRKLREEGEQKLVQMEGELGQARTALQASETTVKNLKINGDVLESQYHSEAEAARKCVDTLVFIINVDRGRIQDLTFVKRCLMSYFPPPVGVYPVAGEPYAGERRPRTLRDAATFALAVVRFRRAQRNGSRVRALEYEKKLRTL